MSVPGIGPLSTAIIYSEYGDISNFSKSHGGRMVKRGSSHPRYILINCYFPLIRFDMTFATYYAKKQGESKPHRVAITHVTKKLIRVIYALEMQYVDYNVQKLR